MADSTQTQFVSQLKRYYSLYTGGVIGFIVLLSILEQMGVPNKVLGYIFLGVTVSLYAGIGILSRTSDVAEYYVAGRRIPALFNGMATAADWMSAASFIGLAGTLYVSGYDGLAFVMGWTGGFCLVALFLAPYLRKFGQFTIPDFLGARYGGDVPRVIGVFAAILCSFTYVIAQIYGLGLIVSRFTGLDFGIGVFVGLGSILLCSFLGGMRAVTWTQVSQYVILIVAYMIPVIWLSVKHTGNPVPQIAYGYVLQQVTAREQVLNDPTPRKASAKPRCAPCSASNRHSMNKNCVRCRRAARNIWRRKERNCRQRSPRSRRCRLSRRKGWPMRKPRWRLSPARWRVRARCGRRLPMPSASGQRRYPPTPNLLPRRMKRAGRSNARIFWHWCCV